MNISLICVSVKNIKSFRILFIFYVRDNAYENNIIVYLFIIYIKYIYIYVFRS